MIRVLFELEISRIRGLMQRALSREMKTEIAQVQHLTISRLKMAPPQFRRPPLVPLFLNPGAPL